MLVTFFIFLYIVISNLLHGNIGFVQTCWRLGTQPLKLVKETREDSKNGYIMGGTIHTRKWRNQYGSQKPANYSVFVLSHGKIMMSYKARDQVPVCGQKSVETKSMTPCQTRDVKNISRKYFFSQFTQTQLNTIYR